MNEEPTIEISIIEWGHEETHPDDIVFCWIPDLDIPAGQYFPEFDIIYIDIPLCELYIEQVITHEIIHRVIYHLEGLQATAAYDRIAELVEGDR